MPTLSPEIIAAAQASMRKWGVPASISLGQFGLESAWGTRMPKGSFNPFGIKALRDHPSVLARTREVIGGRSVMMNLAFAKFANFGEAFDSHGELLATSGYYRKAQTVAKAKPLSAENYARALQGIYATDPNYADSLIKLMRANKLYQYDTLPEVKP